MRRVHYSETHISMARTHPVSQYITQLMSAFFSPLLPIVVCFVCFSFSINSSVQQLYHHGETISVNVHVANNSNRTVKKIKVSVRQFADICLFSTAQYKCTVAEVESE